MEDFENNILQNPIARDKIILDKLYIMHNFHVWKKNICLVYDQWGKNSFIEQILQCHPLKSNGQPLADTDFT